LGFTVVFVDGESLTVGPVLKTARLRKAFARLVAILPAHIAAKTRPAVVLRAE
jgi:hypothetical protein